MKSVFRLFFSPSLPLPSLSPFLYIYYVREFGFVSSGDMPAATMFSKFKSGTATQNQNTNYIDSNPIVQHFEISKQTACAGPELIWKIHDGFKKSDGRVSIYHFFSFILFHNVSFCFRFSFFFLYYSFGFWFLYSFVRPHVYVVCRENKTLSSTLHTHTSHAVRGNKNEWKKQQQQNWIAKHSKEVCFDH